MGRVDGKIALVTGAGSGLGRASALRLAEEGATVIATDINGEAVQETIDQIVAAGGSGWGKRQDVTDEAEWAALIDDITGQYGRLDILVNNAGIILIKSLEQMTLEDFRSQNAVNIDGVFLGMKYGSAAMAKTGKGSIVNMSSVAGITGSANAVGYCASKGAVRLMTKAAAKEMRFAGHDIRVNSIHPGMIDTAMAQSIKDQTGDPEAVDRMVTRQNSRYGRPEEVADAVLYLASDESSFCTGSELVVDGGQTA